MVYSEWVVIEFRLNKSNETDLNYLHNESFHCFYKDKLIKEVINTKFLGLEINI